MSSPHHPLDSPMSDDYSSASTGILDNNSLGGMSGAETLASTFHSM